MKSSQITEKTIARGTGYRIYLNKGIYFADIHKTPIQGFETLQGAAEYLYYQGYIDRKAITALNAE